MPRKKKDIHYIYKTTCNITNRYYIGMHSTTKIDDGYMGSGKRLRYSIRKHGEENHKVEILEFYESRVLLIEAEKEAITPDMITDKNCMNLMGGGTGGFTSENAKKGREATDKILIKKYGDNFKSVIVTNYYNSLTDDEKIKRSKKIIKAHKLIGFDYANFKDKKHSEETKNLISEIKRGTGKGKTNSQYGTCWITKDGENKKIKKEVLNIYISQGWEKGRKLK